MAKIAETPLMLQYMEMKKKHPDAILLFRVGDFYETFSEDAIAASEILGITLTRRANGKAMSVELAGFPHHALDSYLPKLVRAGRRVAICEQLEDPKLAKKLVKRGITELVTPGVNTSPGALQTKENNFLAAIHITKAAIGLAFLDISTGEFLCGETSPEDADRLLGSMAPKELLRMKGTRDYCSQHFSLKCPVFELDDWVYTSEAAEERLLKQFSTSTLKGFGIDDMQAAVIAAGSILHYLDLTSHTRISHITTLSRIDNRRYMHLDRFTIRNLELAHAMGSEGKSLLDVIDKTVSPMGARLLRRWLLLPLLDHVEIGRRQEGVATFLADSALREQAREAAHRLGDMERLGSRVASGKITPRELLSLAEGIRGAMQLKEILLSTGCAPLHDLAATMTDIREVAGWISTAIAPDAPNSLGKGNAIAEGISTELDELRSLKANSHDAILAIQRREMETTGISSLKISFNNVFGYYIEVRNTHRDKVPSDWIRKQTLVSAERYVTPELKMLEEKILGAEDRIKDLETRLYEELLGRINGRFAEIHAAASAAAAADCLLSFAEAAADYGYVRPQVDDSTRLDICEGRHPVIERTMPPGESYVSNSVALDSDPSHPEGGACQIMMITGPNMSGKSALLRQTALIVLMAQIGSFVPARSVKMGVVDKIFTRVGASDNISSGESTFMVEMNEAAAILNNMSQRSLILFDELGRGTSTYDGISIAWAIVENIHENGRFTPKTLFATHYHELNEMEKNFSRIANFNVSVKEIGGKVVFLRKLERGGSEHSFGIHVAKLAGMPPSIVKRAEQVLRQLEEAAKGVESQGDGKQEAQGENGAKTGQKGLKGVSKASVKDIGTQRDGYQLSFFQLDDPLLSQIRDRLLDVNINNLTPIQALNVLSDLQGLLTGK